MRNIIIVVIALFVFNSKAELVATVEPYTRDQQIIMLTILAEASGEGENGMMAVASVIKTRSKNRNISYSRVCLERLQFSCWNNKTIQELENKWMNSKNARFALDLAQNMDILPDNMIFGADHYHTLQVSPYWKDPSKEVLVLGNHVFYKLN